MDLRRLGPDGEGGNLTTSTTGLATRTEAIRATDLAACLAEDARSALVAAVRSIFVKFREVVR